MTREQAIAALNDEWAQGDMDSDEYAAERGRIERQARQDEEVAA